MKNLICLVSRDDVLDFACDLWRSEPFQRSFANKGFIYEQTKRFAWLPRFFAETTNDYLERAHFSTWWNVIMLRPEYTNPIIHDLYYLHEMTHAATMPYVPDIGRAAFDEKMQRNELEASVLSEIAVYLEMPGLREASFDHAIYADRFLNDQFVQRLWATNKDVALEMLRTRRRDVMVSKPEHLMDLTEVWIRRFNDQNALYGITWADRYNDIERVLSGFQSNVFIDRKGASEKLERWLLAEMAADPVDHIPFRQEAELFAPSYWANKAKYEEAMREHERVKAAA